MNYLDLSGGGYTVHVDSVCEPDHGWLVRVRVSALDPEAVHPVLKGSPGGPDDHAGPVLQVDVVLVLKAPALKDEKSF